MNAWAGWAAWIALVLWCVALVVGLVAFFMARALWWQLKPQVAPLIAMFAPTPADTRTDVELIEAFGKYGESSE